MSSLAHMRRMREAEPYAIEELYREYQPRLLSFCRHMLGNQQEAEDAVQLTFLAAHVQLPHADIETSVGAWLFTVARRKCIDILRRRRSEAELDPDTISTAGLAAEVERREDLRRLVGDLQRLDANHRAALLLTQLEDLPQAQVAQVMGTHERRVKRLVFEARQELMGRRDSRDLACRAVQEELANARGSQFRRRHLVAHCEDCEECEEYRTALLAQRTALRAILPVPIFFLATKKAWAAASVPTPHVSVARRILNAVATIPAGAATAVVTVAATGAMGSLPSTPRVPFKPPAPAPAFSAASSSPAAAPARVAKITKPKPAPKPKRVVVTPAPPPPATVGLQNATVSRVVQPAPEPPVVEVEVETVTVEAGGP
jgi:RNA polymerase sigma factor (sigma-70 family)